MKPLPNAAERQLGEVVRRLGRPGFEGALWEFLRRCVAPDDLLILAYRDSALPTILYRQSDHPAPFARIETVYLGGAYLLDPYHELHLTRVPSGLYRLADVAPDAFHRSRYFLEYYQLTTILDELTFIAYPAADVSLHVCLGRDASSGRPFAARDVETCQRLAPLVAALAESHWAALPIEPGPRTDVATQLIGALRTAHGVHLSPRQAEVALLILRGHSTASIALRLDVSAQTVKVFRKQLYSRCAISSQAELFALLVPLLAGRA
jgi:DNA-binding CsgD family transcriptional regulator